MRSLTTVLAGSAALTLTVAFLVPPADARQSADLSSRVEGLFVGSLIGDAAGGPLEFEPPERSMWTATDVVLTAEAVADLAARFALRAYARAPHPYAHWSSNAPAGSITDDSRFKIIFFDHLEASGGIDREGFAAALLRHYADSTGKHGAMRRAWLEEFAYAARWVLGERDPRRALPPERAWGGIPTMAGQMPFLPVAALHPGDPAAAYRQFWAVDFLDNGIGRDLNAALVAGLAAALEPGADWRSVENAMRATDPYGFGDIEWVPRRLDAWLDFAHDAVRRADGRPLRLFDILESELGATTWWEAWVPMTVVFACAEIARYDPLATMQLILEFGHDTDSYMQVAGAFFGALHGREVYPADMRATVERRLYEDHGESVGRWLRLAGFKR